MQMLKCTFIRPAIFSVFIFIFSAGTYNFSFSQKISAGGNHTLLICSDGTVKAWGTNTYGQLGQNPGAMFSSNIPVVVPGLSGTITAVSAGGSHSLALKTDGSVWAWGYNSDGELGDGTTTNTEIPVPVTGLTSGVIAISAGAYHNLALKSDGTVWAWGSNYNGQIGNNTVGANQLTPVKTYSTLINAFAISAGGNHSMALRNDSTVWTWGAGGDGQLGLGTISDSIYPCKVPGLSKVKAIDAGGSHSLALKSSGMVLAWGYNYNGQLGNGSQNPSSVPYPVSSLSNVKVISAGGNHSMALKTDSTVWTWGEDLGTGGCKIVAGSTPVIQNLTATKILGLSGIVAIGSGGQHAVTLKNGETSWNWGYNGSGQLGNGDYSSYLLPVQAHCICGSVYPSVTASADVTVCPGFNSTVTGIAAGGNGAPFSYQWAPVSNINCTTCANAVVNPFFATTYSVTGFDKKMCSAVDSVTIYMKPAPASPVILKSQLYATVCNGVPVTLTASNTSVSYYWMPGGSSASSIIVNPTADTYYVLVTSAGNNCTAADSVQVNHIRANLDVYMASCGNNDGAIYPYPSGGDGTYYYSWSVGGTPTYQSNLPPGTYSVTINDGQGCSVSQQNILIIDQGPLLLPPLTVTDVTCFGAANGTATANPTGGKPPYYYSWSPVNQFTQTATGLGPGLYSITITDAGSCSASKTLSFAILEPVMLTAGISNFTMVSCNGASNGSLTVTASDGTPPYTYSWMPGGNTTQTASGLASGNYTITVTDANGCSAAPATKFITEPNALSASISSTNPSCNGQCNGTAAITAAGGTTPYTYNWLPGGQTTSSVSGLCAASYTANITDANGCSVAKTVALVQPSALIVTNPSVTNATCINACNGIASAAATGGTAPYTYSWSNGMNTAAVSGLCAATYTVTATDANGCSKNNFATISQPTALTTTLTKTDANCNGTCTGSASVVAAGGIGPYTYLWLPSAALTSSAQFLCAGNHTVIITDNNNCIATDTISVGQPLGVPITATATPTSCGAKSGSVSASVSGAGSVPPFSYLWSNGSTSTLVTGLDADIYRCNVTDGNGCFGFADALVSSSNGPAVTVNSVTNVSCMGLANGSINITVTGGTAPYNFFWSNGQTTEDASGLSFGPYEVQVTDASGCLIVKSVSVNQPAYLVLTTTTVPSGCAATNGSATVIAGGGTSAYSYLWSTGGSAATKSALGAGIYKAIVTDSKGCVDSIFVAVQDSGGPVVFVDTVAAASCGSSGFILLVPQDSAAIANYQWNTGSTTQNLANVTPGNYGVVISDTSGCKSVLITPVNPVLPPIKPICLVTVDTLTNENIIVWEKPVSTFIAGFNIYRESSQQGVYQKIAYSPYANVSTYYDPNVDPQSKWSRYRISMLDICGTEGPVSPDHKTMHLAIQSSTPTSTTLIWDSYVGYPFSYYNIYRKDSLTGIWMLIGATPSNITTYKDVSFPQTGDTIYYHVDVDHPGGDCNASIKGFDPLATSVKSGKSNSSDRLAPGGSSINELAMDNRVVVYPNPSNGLFTVELKGISASEIKIFNVLGEAVKTISPVSGKKKIEVNMDEQGEGMYYVRVLSDQGLITRKVALK